LKDVMIIRPEKEIGMGCCGGICSDPYGFVHMESEFEHHDKGREKLGEWYRNNVIGQENEWKVNYVDPRNLLAIVVYFAKHVKAGNISFLSAFQSLLFRMKYYTLFINGEWEKKGM
jgi:hypothetical protein